MKAAEEGRLAAETARAKLELQLASLKEETNLKEERGQREFERQFASVEEKLGNEKQRVTKLEQELKLAAHRISVSARFGVCTIPSHTL